MTERLRSAGYHQFPPKMEIGSTTSPSSSDLSPRKTLLVLVVVIGCFAVLWPKVFYPMLVGSAQQHMKPSPIDKTTGCCDVISEMDVNTIKIMLELCGTIINSTADGATDKLRNKQLIERCRQEILDTCGIDISAVLQEQVRLGQNLKHILDEIRSLNGSLCLKYNFGVSPWRLGVPHRISAPAKESENNIRQERPHQLRSEMIHPAFRERGRAIPPPPPVPPVRPSPRTVEGRPGPIPGMRPTIGGAGHVVPPSKQATSSMSVIMPIYTVGIVIFFTYTLMKIIFKKQPEGVGGSLYPPIEPDPQWRKEVFESERSRLGTRMTRDSITNKLGDEELDQLKRRLRETEMAMERIVEQMAKVPESLKNHAGQDLANGTATPATTTPLSNGDALKPQRQDDDSVAVDDQPTVKILGMEMTASREGGKKWQRPESPVMPAVSPVPPASVNEAIPPPQEIYLEGALPAQSHLLVSDSATEPQPSSGEDPAVVLSGKMTLSVISLDSSGGAEATPTNASGDTKTLLETSDCAPLGVEETKQNDEIFEKSARYENLEAKSLNGPAEKIEQTPQGEDLIKTEAPDVSSQKDLEQSDLTETPLVEEESSKLLDLEKQLADILGEEQALASPSIEQSTQPNDDEPRLEKKPSEAQQIKAISLEDTNQDNLQSPVVDEKTEIAVDSEAPESDEDFVKSTTITSSDAQITPIATKTEQTGDLGSDASGVKEFPEYRELGVVKNGDLNVKIEDSESNQHQQPDSVVSELDEDQQTTDPVGDVRVQNKQMNNSTVGETDLVAKISDEKHTKDVTINTNEVTNKTMDENPISNEESLGQTKQQPSEEINQQTIAVGSEPTFLITGVTSPMTSTVKFEEEGTDCEIEIPLDDLEREVDSLIAEAMACVKQSPPTEEDDLTMERIDEGRNVEEPTASMEPRNDEDQPKELIGVIDKSDKESVREELDVKSDVVEIGSTDNEELDEEIDDNDVEYEEEEEEISEEIDDNDEEQQQQQDEGFNLNDNDRLQPVVGAIDSNNSSMVNGDQASHETTSRTEDSKNSATTLSSTSANTLAENEISESEEEITDDEEEEIIEIEEVEGSSEEDGEEEEEEEEDLNEANNGSNNKLNHISGESESEH